MIKITKNTNVIQSINNKLKAIKRFKIVNRKSI